MDFEAIGKTLQQQYPAYANQPAGAIGEAYVKKMYPAEYQKFTTQQSADINAGKELYVDKAKNEAAAVPAQSLMSDLQKGLTLRDALAKYAGKIKPDDVYSSYNTINYGQNDSGKFQANKGGYGIPAEPIDVLGQLGITKGSKASGLSAAEKLRHDNLISALASLDSAETNLVLGGGAKGPIEGQKTKIPILGQYLNPAGYTYEKTKIENATNMAKAITGGSRVASNVIESYMSSLPAVTDTTEVAKSKLEKLRLELVSQANKFKFDDIIKDYPEVVSELRTNKGKPSLDTLFK